MGPVLVAGMAFNKTAQHSSISCRKCGRNWRFRHQCVFFLFIRTGSSGGRGGGGGGGGGGGLASCPSESGPESVKNRHRPNWRRRFKLTPSSPFPTSSLVYGSKMIFQFFAFSAPPSPPFPCSERPPLNARCEGKGKKSRGFVRRKERLFLFSHCILLFFVKLWKESLREIASFFTPGIYYC